jgi:hypothetical protein
MHRVHPLSQSGVVAAPCLKLNRFCFPTESARVYVGLSLADKRRDPWLKTELGEQQEKPMVESREERIGGRIVLSCCCVICEQWSFFLVQKCVGTKAHSEGQVSQVFSELLVFSWFMFSSEESRSRPAVFVLDLNLRSNRTKGCLHSDIQIIDD